MAERQYRISICGSAVESRPFSPHPSTLDGFVVLRVGGVAIIVTSRRKP